MNATADQLRGKLLTAAFRMPSVQSMVARKSSITNAFVNAVIPVVPPSHEEIEESLRILGMAASNVRCAYCGDTASEWDHLRPLVLQRRPTGYISEIANLVPACGKCNQSKGNQEWRKWMLGPAKLSPARRGLTDVAARIERLEAYTQWRSPVIVDFQQIVGTEEWERYWLLCDQINAEMRRCQEIANDIRMRVVNHCRSNDSTSPG